MNKSFIPNLSKSLVFDLGHVLDEERLKINALPPISLNIANRIFCFAFRPILKKVFIKLTVEREAIHLNITLTFSPQFAIEAQSAVPAEREILPPLRIDLDKRTRRFWIDRVLEFWAVHQSNDPPIQRIKKNDAESSTQHAGARFVLMISRTNLYGSPIFAARKNVLLVFNRGFM